MSETTTDLVDLVFRITRLMKQKMAAPSGMASLSMLQTQTLMFLNQNKETTMSEVAGYLHIELPSATSLINTLVRQKLVRRSSDPRDRRIVKIDLTLTGKTMLEQAINQRKKKLEEFLSYLSPKHKSDLLAILHGVEERLTK
jgi:DNA-binding MarR family transcriptional regulator